MLISSTQFNPASGENANHIPKGIYLQKGEEEKNETQALEEPSELILTSPLGLGPDYTSIFMLF